MPITTKSTKRAQTMTEALPRLKFASLTPTRERSANRASAKPKAKAGGAAKQEIRSFAHLAGLGGSEAARVAPSPRIAVGQEPWPRHRGAARPRDRLERAPQPAVGANEKTLAAADSHGSGAPHRTPGRPTPRKAVATPNRTTNGINAQSALPRTTEKSNERSKRAGCKTARTIRTRGHQDLWGSRHLQPTRRRATPLPPSRDNSGIGAKPSGAYGRHARGRPRRRLHTSR
jgi:hypothetical protein